MSKKTADKSTKTSVVKEKIRDYLDKNWEKLIKDIDSLDPKERVDRRMKLLEYVMPKATAAKTEEKAPQSIAQIILSKEAQFDDYVEEEDLQEKEIIRDEDLRFKVCFSEKATHSFVLVSFHGLSPAVREDSGACHYNRSSQSTGIPRATILAYQQRITSPSPASASSRISLIILARCTSSEMLLPR